MRTEVGDERKRKDSRYIHLRKNPQEQVTDRTWAEPVVSCLGRRTGRSVEEGSTGRLSSNTGTGESSELSNGYF